MHRAEGRRTALIEFFLVSSVIHDYQTSWILLTSLKDRYLNQQLGIQSWHDLQNIYHP
jgi:hypothetical protein